MDLEPLGTWETNKHLNIGFTASKEVKFGFDSTDIVQTSTIISGDPYDRSWHHFAFTYNQGNREINIYIRIGLQVLAFF